MLPLGSLLLVLCAVTAITTAEARTVAAAAESSQTSVHKSTQFRRLQEPQADIPTAGEVCASAALRGECSVSDSSIYLLCPVECRRASELAHATSSSPGPASLSSARESDGSPGKLGPPSPNGSGQPYAASCAVLVLLDGGCAHDLSAQDRSVPAGTRVGDICQAECNGHGTCAATAADISFLGRAEDTSGTEHSVVLGDGACLDSGGVRLSPSSNVTIDAGGDVAPDGRFTLSLWLLKAPIEVWERKSEDDSSHAWIEMLYSHPPAEPVPPPPPSVRVGCFADNTDGVRDLESTGTSSSSASLTASTTEEALAQCGTICRGYRYLGLQWANECYCGNSYGGQGELTCATCCEDCAVGNQVCGNMNAVYEVATVEDDFARSTVSQSACSERTCAQLGWPTGRAFDDVCANNIVGGRCINEASAAEAAGTCAAAGTRLCTPGELEAGEGAATGCHSSCGCAHSSMFWSRSTTFGGLNCSADALVVVSGSNSQRATHPTTCMQVDQRAAVRCCADALGAAACDGSNGDSGDFIAIYTERQSWLDHFELVVDVAGMATEAFDVSFHRDAVPQWTHLSIVVDGGSRPKLFVDGEERRASRQGLTLAGFVFLAFEQLTNSRGFEVLSGPCTVGRRHGEIPGIPGAVGTLSCVSRFDYDGDEQCTIESDLSNAMVVSCPQFNTEYSDYITIDGKRFMHDFDEAAKCPLGTPLATGSEIQWNSVGGSGRGWEICAGIPTVDLRRRFRGVGLGPVSFVGTTGTAFLDTASVGISGTVAMLQLYADTMTPDTAECVYDRGRRLVQSGRMELAAASECRGTTITGCTSRTATVTTRIDPTGIVDAIGEVDDGSCTFTEITGSWHLEQGVVTVANTWLRIELQGSYTRPLVFVSALSRQSNSQAVVRVGNIHVSVSGRWSFQIRAEEKSCRRTELTQLSERASFLVIEAGFVSGSCQASLLRVENPEWHRVSLLQPVQVGSQMVVVSQVQNFHQRLGFVTTRLHMASNERRAEADREVIMSTALCQDDPTWTDEQQAGGRTTCAAVAQNRGYCDANYISIVLDNIVNHYAIQSTPERYAEEVQRGCPKSCAVCTSSGVVSTITAATINPRFAFFVQVEVGEGVFCPDTQFYAEYFSNLDLSGSPLVAVCEPDRPSWNWGTCCGGIPPAMRPEQMDSWFSVRWSTQIVAPDELTFVVSSYASGGSRILVDKVIELDAWQQHGSHFDSDPVMVGPGTHMLSYEYRAAGRLGQLVSNPFAVLSWTIQDGSITSMPVDSNDRLTYADVGWLACPSGTSTIGAGIQYQAGYTTTVDLAVDIVFDSAARFEITPALFASTVSTDAVPGRHPRLLAADSSGARFAVEMVTCDDLNSARNSQPVVMGWIALASPGTVDDARLQQSPTQTSDIAALLAAAHKMRLPAYLRWRNGSDPCHNRCVRCILFCLVCLVLSCLVLSWIVFLLDVLLMSCVLG
eukprot:SAG22_NODE_215_length_14950_cov_4.960676_7_plen_1457_part_00